MDIDLTQKLRQKMSFRSRMRGRYNASELYFIVNGLLSPEEWINQSPRPIKEIIKMWDGIGVHSQLESLLGKEHCEKKQVFIYKDVTLVGKADFMPPDHKEEIWEWKTSSRKMAEAKDWHKHQVKLYCTMFGKKTGRIYQPVKNNEGVYLKCIGTVERDDVWFENQIEKLYEFNKKVDILWEKQNSTLST